MKVYLMMQRNLNQYCVESVLNVFDTRGYAEYNCALHKAIDTDCNVSNYEYYVKEMEVINGWD